MQRTKVALITGCAVRVGRQIATHLAAKGWDLALHYRSSSSEISGFEKELRSEYPEQQFFAFHADFNVIDQTQGLIQLVIERYGHIDLLVNNASVFEPSSLKKTSSELLIRQMMVNFISPFILMRDFANSAGKGHIINIADARIASNKSDYIAYTLSKKSLWDLTKIAALEFAPGIRVNAVAPGAVLAPVGKDLSYLEKVAAITPMKTPAGIEPVLKSIDYILENQDLTGQLIFCDGGAHLL